MTLVYHIEDIKVRALALGRPYGGRGNRHTIMVTPREQVYRGKKRQCRGGTPCAICSRTSRNRTTNRKRDRCGSVGTARRSASRCRSGTLWRRSRQRKI